MKNFFLGMVTLIALSLVGCSNDDDVRFYNVTFDTQNEQTIAKQTVEENGFVKKPDVKLVKKGYLFDFWSFNGKEFNFTETAIKEDITLVAKWSLDKTEVTYATITHDDFIKWPLKEMRLVKASIHKMKWFKGAWGCEVYLKDPNGNTSRGFYGTSPYGMFSMPIVISDDQIDQTYVFKLFKDKYMSSPQLGFGGIKADCYNGKKWLTKYTYGIDYFDETIRGTIIKVQYETNKGIKLSTLNDVIYFDELKESDIKKFDDFINKNVHINCLKINETWISKLDHAGKIQVSENLGGTGNPVKLNE